MSKIQLGALTPRQLALMLAEHPAVKAVTQDGVTWKVFPKDATKRPVFFTSIRFGNGVTLANILRDLRRSGIDLERPEPTPETTTKETAVAAPTPKDMPTSTVTRLPRDAREEIAELRDMVRKSTEANASEVGAALGMLAEADRRITELMGRVARLEGQLVGARKAPSVTELTRGAVLRWFREHPMMRISPQLLEMNAGDQLPEARGKTTVAGVCADLVKAGHLCGGGTKTGAGTHGIYWYDPAQDERLDEGPE